MRISISTVPWAAAIAGLWMSARVAAAVPATTARIEGAPAPARAVFERIRGLAGDWEGTVVWSGARTDSGKMNATYYATGHGTAVVENLTVDREPVMTSVYHMDGATLRMTHFCGAGNQPRLKAERIEDGGATVRFAFVDVTNLAGPSAGHVHEVELQFLDESHVVLTFGFIAGGAVSRERIDLHRVAGAPDRKS
jgi:hypothetical protein